MNEYQHTILCVDDEQNILNSVKRLLRKEGYRLLTATSGEEGLRLLEEHDVQLVITDQRMPEMSGTEFLALVKERYPDAIRIVLTGYTDVDAITESINRGHVYKFFLKPWNDQSLKLEIKQALEKYDLIQANNKLHEKVMEQNEELKTINENLEFCVHKRTMELQIQNQALELSQAVLEDLPIPIVGVSAEGMIVMINNQVRALRASNGGIEVGGDVGDCFSPDIKERAMIVLATNKRETVNGFPLSDETYKIDLLPLSGKFRDKGVVMTFSKLAA